MGNWEICIFVKKDTQILVCVISQELAKPLFTCLATTLTWSIQSTNKKCVIKTPRPAYLKRFFLVQRVSFTPGSQVLSAGSSEPGHCKTKDSSSWHDNGPITRHFKRCRRHRTEDALSLPLTAMFTHTFPKAHPTTKARPVVKGIAPAEPSRILTLPITPGGSFSLNTIYSKHRVLKSQGLIILLGQGSCQVMEVSFRGCALGT